MPRFQQLKRVPHARPAVSAAAAAKTLTREGYEQSEPTRTPLFKPPEPELEESDLSLRTTCYISDRISRDSFKGVVLQGGLFQANLHIDQQKLQLERKKKRNEEEPTVASSSYEQTSSEDYGGNNRLNCKYDQQHRNRRDSQRRRRHNYSNEDTSELIELLFGRFFGRDRQIIRRSAGACVESSIDGNANCMASGDVDIVAGADKSRDAYVDTSELLTLTNGSLTESFLTLSRAQSDEPQAIAKAASTVLAVGAIDFQVDQTNRRDISSSKGSKMDDEIAGATAPSAAVSTFGVPVTSTVNEEIIPQSDRIVNSPTSISDNEVSTYEVSVENDDVREPSKMTGESKIVLDLGNYSKDLDSEANSCPLCACKYQPLATSATHRHRGHSRFGRLRTPEICKRVSTNANASPGTVLDKSDNLETAAMMMEWRETMWPSEAKSPSNRNFDINSSDNEVAVSDSDRGGTSHGTSYSQRPNHWPDQPTERRNLKEKSPKKSSSKTGNQERQVEERQLGRRERQKKRGEETDKRDRRSDEESEKQPRRRQKSRKLRRRQSHESSL